jgi:hypothetical protein
MSKLKNIHLKLVELLGTISKANGYNNDIVLVTRTYKFIDHVSAYPIICVIQGEDAVVNQSEDGELYGRSAAFAAVGYVQCNSDTGDDGNLTDAADSLCEDIENCLLDPYNQSSLFIDTTAKDLNLVNRIPFLDFKKNTGQISVGFQIGYYHGIPV